MNASHASTLYAANDIVTFQYEGVTMKGYIQSSEIIETTKYSWFGFHKVHKLEIYYVVVPLPPHHRDKYLYTVSEDSIVQLQIEKRLDDLVNL